MSYLVKPSPATPVYADATQQKVVFNQGPGKVYYSTTSDTNSSDTEIGVGSSATINATQYFVAEAAKEAKLRISSVVSGIETATALPGVWAGDYVPVTAETGTDLAHAEKKLRLSSVWLPVNKTITGIGYLLGAGGGTNKVIAALFDSNGRKLANSSETTEGTVAGTEKTIQSLAFTSTYKATGPGLYYIGITGNGTTAKMRAIPANTAGANVFAGEVEIATKNVVPASVTVPTTFTGGKGPVAFIY